MISQLTFPLFIVLEAGDKKMTELWRTSVIKENLNPSWTITDGQFKIPAFKHVVAHMWDWDKFTSDGTTPSLLPPPPTNPQPQFLIVGISTDFMGRVEFTPSLVHAFQRGSFFTVPSFLFILFSRTTPSH